MLRKKEKQTLTRLFLLGVGAPIGLDRFYEGDVTGGFLAILGFLVALITVVGLLVWIVPFISKTFRLLREFENAEDCLLYTSPSPRDTSSSRMPSSA